MLYHVAMDACIYIYILYTRVYIYIYLFIHLFIYLYIYLYTIDSHIYKLYIIHIGRYNSKMGLKSSPTNKWRV